MIQGKWFAPGEDLSAEVLPLRTEVFGDPGSAVDPEGWNTLVYLDGQPAASGRIWWEDGAFWLGRVGVVPPLRGRRLGDLALRLLLFKAQSHAAREVRLRCGEDTEGFFARLGFRPVRREGGTVEMMIPGNEISLDSCAGCRKQGCPNRKEP
jgi:GNAT superfamily N-acetyltransferase